MRSALVMRAWSIPRISLTRPPLARQLSTSERMSSNPGNVANPETTMISEAPRRASCTASIWPAWSLVTRCEEPCSSPCARGWGGDPGAHHRHPRRVRRGHAVRRHQALRGGPAQRGAVGLHSAQQPRRAPAPGRPRRPDRVGPTRGAPLQRAAGPLRDGHRAHRQIRGRDGSEAASEW